MRDDVGQTAPKTIAIEVVTGAAKERQEMQAVGAGSRPASPEAATSPKPAGGGLDPAWQRAQACCWKNVSSLGATSDGGACSSMRTRAHCQADLDRGICG